jgi:hypothetical protein
MVDLDTSHPANWLPVIRDLGHEVIGVYDGGTVYPEGYARRFASERGIEQVFDSLEAMADAVDVAIIHSCNWDLHIERALPFAAAGKGLLIDKPMAGKLPDLQKLLEWEKRGVKITGGSSLRYCDELIDWQASHEMNDILFAHTGCAVDEFNYGIHAYSFLHGLLGPGIESVRYLGTNVQHLVEISWTDGRHGIVGVGTTAGYLPFYATVVTQKDVSHIKVNNAGLYQALLKNVLPYFAGETAAPIPLQSLIEVELSAIAAKLSRQSGGKRIFLQDIPAHEAGYDGTRFGTEYKIQKISANK